MVLNDNIRTFSAIFSVSKVTEIYRMADDFCREFAFQTGKCMIEGKITRHPDIGRLSAAGILYPTSCHFVVDCLSLQLVATKETRH